jgi:hypothetical protein
VVVTNYLRGQVVEHLGSSYVALVDHTSGSVSEPGVGAQWTLHWDLVVRGLGDGDRGDITVASNATSLTIDAGAVTTTKMGGDVTTAGKTLLTAADAAAQRTALGLGALATLSQAQWSDIVDVTSQHLIGRHSGSAGPAQEVTVGHGVEFSGSGIRRGQLLGDVEAAAGSSTTTISTGAVTLAKLANLATDTLIGRQSPSTGVPETIACTQAGRDLLDDASAAAQRTTLGLGSAATLTITSGTAAPTGGSDGDIYLQYV